MLPTLLLMYLMISWMKKGNRMDLNLQFLRLWMNFFRNMSSSSTE